MKKRTKGKLMNDYEKLRHEMIRDKVGGAIKENPGNYRKALEEIGFTWFDDGCSSEEEEESVARPENDRQRLLVTYFDGKAELSAAILNALQAERDSEAPNYPLIRRYFRAANPRLKKLILSGLESNPANSDLLTDLVFFNEFNHDLPELVDLFIRACTITDDLQEFSEIALEFYYSALADGYDALYALRDIFAAGSDKRKIIDYLIMETNHNDREEDMRF